MLLPLRGEIWPKAKRAPQPACQAIPASGRAIDIGPIAVACGDLTNRRARPDACPPGRDPFLSAKPSPFLRSNREGDGARTYAPGATSAAWAFTFASGKAATHTLHSGTLSGEEPCILAAHSSGVRLAARVRLGRMSGSEEAMASEKLVPVLAVILLAVSGVGVWALGLWDTGATPREMLRLSPAEQKVRSYVAQLRAPKTFVRRTAVEGLGNLWHSEYIDQAVPGLIQALYDPEWDVRLAAARALSLIGDRRAVPGLIASATDGANRTEVRVAAAAALGKMGAPQAAGPLLPVVTDQASDAEVRAAAIEALANIDGAQPAQPFIAALKDEEARVRRAAAVGLGTVKARQAIDALIEALEDPDVLVVDAAAWALAQIGDGRALEPLCGLLRSKIARLRWSGAHSLGALGDKRAVPKLAEAAAKDADSSVAATAVFALGQIGTADTAGPVARALRHPAPKVRNAAAAALGRIRDPRSVEALLAYLKARDPSHSVRVVAAQSLGQLGKALSLKPLLEMLAGPGAEDRAAAAWALGVSLRPVEAVEPLVEALKDKHADVREMAARTLGDIGDRRAVPGLIDALAAAGADESYRVRQRVVEALGKLGDPRAVEPLLGVREPGDKTLGLLVITALGRIGDRRAGPALIAALKSARLEGREAAAIALGRIKDPAAVEALIDVVENTRGSGGQRPKSRRVVISTDVLVAAIDALAEIGDPRAVPALRAAADRGHPDVVPVAVRAIAEIMQKSGGTIADVSTSRPRPGAAAGPAKNAPR